MEVLIRPWVLEDLPAVRRILWESWVSAYGPFIPLEDLRRYHEETYRMSALIRLFESVQVHGFIGAADGETAGFARTQFHRNENRLYLASLYLLPGCQRRGIGGRLLAAAEEQARIQNLDRIWVGVMVQNEAAWRWYDKRGFRFIRQEPFQISRTVVLNRIGYKVL
jgi:ribosomal protein S18 acetylase RimI-like enzyme